MRPIVTVRQAVSAVTAAGERNVNSGKDFGVAASFPVAAGPAKRVRRPCPALRLFLAPQDFPASFPFAGRTDGPGVAFIRLDSPAPARPQNFGVPRPRRRRVGRWLPTGTAPIGQPVPQLDQLGNYVTRADVVRRDSRIGNCSVFQASAKPKYWLTSSMVNWFRSLQAEFWFANKPGAENASDWSTVFVHETGTIHSWCSSPLASWS